jgi:hypothetical protein
MLRFVTLIRIVYGCVSISFVFPLRHRVYLCTAHSSEVEIEKGCFDVQGVRRILFISNHLHALVKTRYTDPLLRDVLARIDMISIGRDTEEDS